MLLGPQGLVYDRGYRVVDRIAVARDKADTGASVEHVVDAACALGAHRTHDVTAGHVKAVGEGFVGAIARGCLLYTSRCV